jgi:hypothetical protein
MAASAPHSWLRPLWVRLALVGMCLAMLAVEFVYLGDPLWLVLWVGAAGYAVWDLFLRGTYSHGADADEPRQPEP